MRQYCNLPNKPIIQYYRVSLKKRSLTRLAPKVLNKAPRRSMRMKISPKHCKIFSTCDLGTKTLWQSSLWLLLAWSCGKYQARRAVVNKPSQWELWRVFNNHLSCSKRKFVQMQFTRGNRKGINLYDPCFMNTVENLGIKNSAADCTVHISHGLCSA